MGGKELLLAIFTVLFLTSALVLVLGDDIQSSVQEQVTFQADDPLIQGGDHDHSNASQHMFSTDNMELLDFNIS